MRKQDSMWVCFRGRFRDTARQRTYRGPTNPQWYLYANGRILGELNSSGATSAYTWGADGLAVQRRIVAGNSLYFHFGPQAETRYVTNSAGAVVLSYVYTAYGQTISLVGTEYNRHRYGGKVGYFTDIKGQILAWHRWYEPQAYRWLNRDPISYDGGDNMYAYVGGDPVKFVDPSGLAPFQNNSDKPMERTCMA